MKKLIIKMIIAILIMCSGLCNYSFAADENCEIEITSSQESYKPGDQVRLVLRVKNITSASEGISIYAAILTFDPSVFDFLDVTGNNIRTDNDIVWLSENLLNEERQDAANGTVLLNAYTPDLESSKDDANILAIYLKVKDNVKDGNYDIIFEGNQFLR